MAVSDVSVLDVPPQLSTRPGRLRRLGRAARKRPIGTFGFVLLAVVTLCAVFGPGLSVGGQQIVPGFAPFPPNETNPLNVEQAPDSTHWLGTDMVGRDVFSRLIYGARPSLLVGVLATGLGVLLGTVIGVYSGYARGIPDQILQRIMDAVMAFPPLILLMALVSVLTPSLTNIILVLVIFIAPSSSRVVRSAVLAITGNTYIESARAIGASPMRIAVLHVVPNIFAPILVLISTIIGGTILAEAALSFLGLGVPPPDATWGSMLSGGNATGVLQRSPWLALAPGIAITLTVLAFNLIGDTLRDVLDPKLRGR